MEPERTAESSDCTAPSTETAASVPVAIAPFTFETAPKIVCRPGVVAASAAPGSGAGESLGAIVWQALFRHGRYRAPPSSTDSGVAGVVGGSGSPQDPYSRPRASLLLVTDADTFRANRHAPCLDSLVAEGFDVVTYSGVVADPPESNVLEATQLAKDSAVSGVVGFGGGSSLDVAKVAAYLAHEHCTEQLVDIFGVNMCKRSQRLPLVQVPTTAGTGSEVTAVSIITTGDAQKKAVVSPVLLPDCAVLDGALTLSMPRGLTAATGIDAMVHAIEAITSRIRKNPFSRALALDALRLLRANIEGVCGSRAGDVNARSAMLLGATYAGMAFANAPVGAVHALAYPVGATFHVAHGVSNALMLSHVLRFNAEEPGAAAEYAALQRMLFPDVAISGDGDLPAALAFADSMHALSASLGLPMRLRDVGISEGDVPKLASDAMLQSRLLLNNPRDVTLEDATKLYSSAL